MSTPTVSPQAAAPTAAPAARRRALLGVAAVAVLAGAGYGAWWALVARHSEHTDNAYVQARVVQVTAQAGGTVTAVEVDDNDAVRAGQVLLRIDPTDARLALEQAEAQLAQTVREVRQLYSGSDALAAQVAAREADLRRLQADLARAQDDVNRRAGLVDSGAVGREEFNHASAQLAAARSAVAAAKAALDSAREQQRGSTVLTDGGPVETQPQVLRAAARVREAWVALQRTTLPAPIAGHVARRSVQLGQRLQPGAPVLSVVDLAGAWVDANFKEGQLRSLRIGQPAELVADVYGERVVYHGRVAGLGAGTGAAFALLPAQNATGNWIKVVQRVPVRIALDAQEIAAHPLRVGLSMNVVVDVSRQDGALLAPAGAAPAHPDRTTVYDDLAREADERVRRIIAANRGSARPAPAVRPAT
jgi:membrane fusion protein (multidrug efflux system)